jgi:hypothetical protein
MHENKPARFAGCTKHPGEAIPSRLNPQPRPPQV